MVYEVSIWIFYMVYVFLYSLWVFNMFWGLLYGLWVIYGSSIRPINHIEDLVNHIEDPYRRPCKPYRSYESGSAVAFPGDPQAIEAEFLGGRKGGGAEFHS